MLCTDPKLMPQFMPAPARENWVGTLFSEMS